MELIDFLKHQNNFINKIESTSELIDFNNDLIEKLEFEKKYPFIFSEKTMRILVGNGFIYQGVRMGINYPFYENIEKHIRVSNIENNMVFSNLKLEDDSFKKYITIPSEDFFTEDYLLCIMNGKK